MVVSTPKTWFIGACFFLVTSSLFAERKLLLLDFTNRGSSQETEYLGATLKDSIRNTLNKNFSFKEADPKDWKFIAESNYIYPEDYNTRTASMSLGLLTGQDVVISGDFLVSRGKSAGAADEITVTVKFLDVTQRKFVATFSVKGPADTRIFETVEKVAEEISKKAALILPESGANWTRDSGGGRMFANVYVGLRVGAGAYSLGYSDRLVLNQPIAAATIRTNFVFIDPTLSIEARLFLLQETHNTENNPELVGIDTNTTSLGALFLTGYGFAISNQFELRPLFGGGYIFQSAEASGIRSASVNISFPGLVGGLETAYRLNLSTSLILEYLSVLQFDGQGTLLNQLSLGINVRF